MSRPRLLALAAAAVTTTALLAAPAGAADTATSFSLTSGSLSITVPASAALGSAAAAAGTISAALGKVQVDDSRGALTASWTAKVMSTGFSTTSGTTTVTIPATDLRYDPGAPTIVSGTPVLTPGLLLLDLSTAQTAMSATATGSNAASWNPTFTVEIPGAAVAGTYSGTVTHSVS